MAGEYGEPWRQWSEWPGEIVDSGGGHLGDFTGLDPDGNDGERKSDAMFRTLACVNALAGIRDPAAFVQAARDYDEAHRVLPTLSNPNEVTDGRIRLLDALSRLRAELGEGEG